MSTVLTAHQLAKKLLEMPDLPVTAYDGSYCPDLCYVDEVFEEGKLIRITVDEYVPNSERR